MNDKDQNQQKSAKLPGFLRANAFLLLLVAGLLPNLLFILAGPFYLAERLFSPTLYCIAALIMIFLPRWLGWLAFALVLIFDLGFMVMAAFHMPFDVIFDSIRYLVSLKVSAAFFYILIVTTMLATTYISARLASRRRQTLRMASPFPIFIFVVLLTTWDFKYNLPFFVMGEVPPFESAVSQNHLSAERSKSEGKNLLIVMVEGLGAFADPAERKLFEDRITANLPANRFDYLKGTTTYSGSTTGAASRELCGRWGDYLTYLDKGPQDCLPRRFQAAGYETFAWHGFDESMFQRNEWYPLIGFGHLNFEAELLRDHASALTGRCGSVFTGLCDPQVADVVHAELVKDGGKPKMGYWLTLNTHIPYVPKTDGQLHCHGDAPAIGNATICELSEHWLDVFAKVNEIASDPDLPPTDILIVGDHHTPLWERGAKMHFTLSKVDWHLLRDRRTYQNLAGLPSASPSAN